ncbi:hypothetical protein Tco_0761984, partial [Tanacetum coccineum]
MGHLPYWQSHETPLVDENDKEIKGSGSKAWALLKIKGLDDAWTCLTQQTHPGSHSVKKHRKKE